MEEGGACSVHVTDEEFLPRFGCKAQKEETTWKS